MNLDLKNILKKVEPVILAIKKFKVWLVLLVILMLFGFIFYRINYLNNLEPTDDTIEERIKTIQRPKIDKNIVEKLENLEHENIQVQSLFNQARENPFTE